MIDFLAGAPVVTLMAVVALGAALGLIPFGPLRLGTAGALFVGLAVGALDPRLGEGLALVQNVGLILFVYGVGIAAGETFFADLRRQLPLMGAAVGAVALAAVVALVVGGWLGLDAGLVAGTFAGALTSTPTLAAAAAATGSPDAAVGYSIGYPIGVVLAMVLVAIVLARPWPGRRDPGGGADRLLIEHAVVERAVDLDDVPGWRSEDIKMSYHVRDGRTRVLDPDQGLCAGDQVTIVGVPATVREAVAFVGRPLDRELTTDRAVVDHAHITVSSDEAVGRTVAQLDLPARFGWLVTRVRRGDADLVARDALVLQPGDRVLAVVPHGEMARAKEFFGDSERRVSEFDPIGFGLGILAGLLVGAVSVPLPGGISFSLGSAAGPLVAGMVLGAVHRTGPIQWTMPLSVNLTLRQVGLLFFLAAVGLASGPQFAAQAVTADGARTVALAVAVLGVSGAAFVVAARVLGISAPRGAGAVAGYVGQPAVLSFAQGRVHDERVEAGYAALFALGIIAKILAVQIMAAAL